jgi:hypothetical protein
MQVQKLTVSPLADITSIISGTEAVWPWEVTEVYENGATIAFTWDEETKILDIPTYAGGVVLVEFNLYLIFNAPSQYLPSDPTNPASPLVFWENRLTSFISYSTSIKSFESGLTEITIGSFGIRIDDEWLPLIQNILIFTSRIVRIYLDDVIKFKGITTRSAVSNFTLTVSIQKRQTILDSECSWGDPDYLNRINRSSSNAYYTGANIPEEYENFAIPMVFGSTTPYELGDTEEIDLGQQGAFSIIPLASNGFSRRPNTNSVILRVIPTSATGGILGRMPAYQTLASVSPISEALTGQGHVLGRYEQASNAVTFSDMILGETCVLDRVSPGLTVGARIYGRSATRSFFYLGFDEPPGGGNFDTITSADRYRHFFCVDTPKGTWNTPAVLSSTLTPAGHRWLTISGVTGLDLTASDVYVVLNNISGAKSGPKVMEWALEQHGYTVSTGSFTIMNTLYPDTVCMQAGFGTTLQTLGTFLSEINRTLLTVLVFPASNDSPYLVRINPTAAASQTLDETQITGLSWGSEYRDQTKNVIFSPRYFRSDAALANLTFNVPSPRAEIWASERTLKIDHVLEESTTDRFDEIAGFYGSPVTTVKFTLLDDTVTLELADMIQIDHPEFQKKMIVTTIEQLPIGRSIQGRYLYVNDN